METKIDNRALHGTSDTGQLVKESVYKVKRPNSNVYDRVHFETSSNMVYDATKDNIASKIVRRGDNGEIATGALNVTGKATISGAAEIGSNVSIGGATTIKGATNIQNSLDVDVNLNVDGTTKLVGAVTTDSTVSVGTGLTVRGGGANITGTLTSSDKLTVSSNGASITGNTSTSGTLTSGGKLTVNGGGAEIKNNLSVGEVITSLETTKAPFVINSTAVVSKLNADMVDGRNVDDAVTDANTLWTASKINTMKADKAITITGNNGLNGGGSLSANRIISHDNIAKTTPTSIANTTGTTLTVVKSVEGNAQGHITKVETIDLDGRYAHKSRKITVGTGLTGGGDFTADRSISHADTSTQPSIITVAPTMIQNVELDGMGHVTKMTSYNLDGRYYTKAGVDELLAGQTTNIGDNFLRKKKEDRDFNEDGVFMKSFDITYNATNNSIEFNFV